MELINEPRPFALEELFFSVTDLKGRIQRSNDVFRRVAGYSWADLKNKPHNIIRHPDMPRVVFQLLWTYIQSGQPVVAYVKNLARDGRYYWVVALVVPIPDGYLSVRLKPSSALFSTAKDLYAELRAVEASIENESNDRKAAMAASKALLDKKLAGLGFNGYEEFMREVLKLEMQSREAKRRRPVHQMGSSDSSMARKDPAKVDALKNSARTFDKLLDVLSALFADLEAYVGINQGVREKSESVINISESLRTIALSGGVEADKLGTKAAGLRPVLDWLRSFSIQIVKEGTRLSGLLVELTHEVDRVVFGLSAAKLQIEMNSLFAHELVQYAQTDHDSTIDNGTSEDVIESLHKSSCDTVQGGLSSLGAVKDKLRALRESQSKLLDLSGSLRPIYLTGKIEMADGAGPRLTRVFSDLNDQLNETVANINGLKDLLETLEIHLSRGMAHATHVNETTATIDSQLMAMKKFAS